MRQHLPEHDRVSKFPQLSTECESEINECEKCITEKELFEALKSVPNDKSLGNDSLTKEFFETLTFLCVLHSFGKEDFCTSQRQAIIKLIEKKTKIKEKFKIWGQVLH